MKMQAKTRGALAIALTLALGAAQPGLAQEGSAQGGGTVITKQYDDGGVYQGTFRDGKQHGTGTYRLPNGYEYSGEWVDGEILGQGIARFPNGSVYEGAFAQGKPDGTGKITFADGGTYEGDWADGEITGIGRRDLRQRRSLRGRVPERAAPRHRADGKPRRLCLRRRLDQRDQGRQGPHHLSRRRGLRGRPRRAACAKDAAR